MTALADDLKRFRDFAWNISPAFGQQIDALYLKGMGFGDGTSLQDVLDQLVTGVSSAAQAAGISAKNYFDAQTQINLMAAANRAGVPVDQYVNPAVARNQLSSILGGNTGGKNSLGTLMLLGIAAAGLFIFVETEKTSRHVGRR